MARVLYLSYDGLTDPLGQSQILPYLRGLSDKGHDITVISFEKDFLFKDLRPMIQKICNKSSIYWHPLPYTKKPPILSTLKDLRRLEAEVAKLQNQKPFDFLHCRSYLTSIIALKFKREQQLPFIFDMRGFYADERVDGKIWNLNNLIYKKIYNYFKRKERHFLEEADAVISLTHVGKSEIIRWFNEDSRFGGNPDYYNFDRVEAVTQKITVIPCATDMNLFNPENVSDEKKKWICAVHGLDPELEYLGYVGSLGTWYMAEEMLQFYKVLLESKPRVRFIIISHDNIEFLRKKSEEMGIPRSYLIQVKAQRKEMPALMSLMSASVFFILPAYSKKASSPTKQGELMAMGVPVICNDGVGDSGTITRDSQTGIVISEFSRADFGKVAAEWDSIKSISPQKIRKAAEAYFALDKGIKDYNRIYFGIGTKNTATIEKYNNQ